MPLHKTAEFPKPSDWDEFENICTDLIEKEWEAKDAQGYGRQGQTQNGVDILCTPYWLEDQKCAVQVKNTDSLSWNDIEDEIEKVGDSDLEISEYYIFTSMASDVSLQKKVKKENNKRKKAGKFEIGIWMWDKITRKMVDHNSILKSYYPQYFPQSNTEKKSKKPSSSFLNWKNKCLDRMEEKIEKVVAMDGSSPYSEGYWTLSYELLGEFEEKSMKEFKESLRKAKYSYSGWPMWNDLTGGDSYPSRGNIECLLLDENPGHCDFWVASPEGRLFILRGYESDSGRKYDLGEKFDVHKPVWNVAEALFHAQNLIEELDADSSKIRISVKWTGLDGRSLKTERMGFMPRERICRQERIEVNEVVNVSNIEENLEDIMEKLTKELYNRFHFFDPTEGLYRRESEEILKRRQ